MIKSGKFKVSMHWMLWPIRNSGDRFGVAHYSALYGRSPNQAQVHSDFPEDQIPALAEALHCHPEQISRIWFCPPGCIFLIFQRVKRPKGQKEGSHDRLSAAY